MPQIERPLGRVAAPRSGQDYGADSKPAPEVTAKVRRLLKCKQSNEHMQRVMLEHAGSFGTDATAVLEAARKMAYCGSWVWLRDYIEHHKVRMVRAAFCNKRNLCTFCDAARSRRVIAQVMPKVQALHKRKLNSYMMTLTIPSGPHLLPLVVVLFTSLRKLWLRKKVNKAGALRHVLGMIASLELTRNRITRHWHAHIHAIITLELGRRVDARELRADWSAYNGGIQVDLKPIKDPQRDLVEVFKYMLKPGELYEVGNSSKTAGNALSSLDRIEAWLVLRKRRTRFAYGLYLGLMDDELVEPELTGEFVDWFLYWNKNKRTYRLQRKKDGFHGLV